MPRAMANSINEMNLHDKFTFLVSGLGCENLIVEWEEIMVKICTLVFEIYKDRKSKYDNLENSNL